MDYPITPVPFTSVHLDDAFWSPRIETNRRVTIPFALKECEETGRIDNFAIAGGLMEGAYRGVYPFDDTDVYKIIEGAAYTLSLRADRDLERYLDDLIAKIAAAQEADGYLYTARTIGTERLHGWTGETRWSNLGRSHELYNAGHLYEAAVAHCQATGKRTLLEVAIKNADLVARVFGRDRRRDVPGHQEIEIGLAKLYRLSDEERYLRLAQFFLDERGCPDGRSLYGEYAQDHEPVTEQREAVGHAVRAVYMYASMADLAALAGARRYVAALDRIWENVVSKKLYLTGGIGARHEGEAFGGDCELPNRTAFCETCAAIGNAMWNHRMFLLHGDAKYLDVLERVLYNGFLAGVSLSGDAFFYTNPLESDGEYEFNEGTTTRSPWFDCACCPSNVTRFMPLIAGYVYACRDEAIYVNLFAGGSATVEMVGSVVCIRQETRYPWEGAIRIVVQPERPSEFAIHLRIPGWARNRPVPGDLYRYMSASEERPALKVNGAPVCLDLEWGFARIRRTWRQGDLIEVDLPMPVRRVLCAGKVKGNAGKVALERGPLVYCAEWPDNGGRALDLVLPEGAALRAKYREDLLDGIVVIHREAVHPRRDQRGISVAIPYYAWSHRGAGEMAVWLPYRPSRGQYRKPQGHR